MDPNNQRRLRPSIKTTLILIVTVLLGIAVGLLVTQLVNNGEDTSNTATEGQVHEHDDIDPVRDDPEVAAQAAMVAVFSYDPASQETTFEQLGDVRDQLTGTLGELADNPPTGDQAAAQRPSEWDSWARSGDQVRAFANVAAGSAPVGEDETTATVTVDVEQRIIHPDGETTPYEEMVADVEMVYEAEQWKAANYEITGIN